MSREELLRLASALNGLCILGCLPGSPADLAGLKYGDVVIEVNGVETPSWAAYLRAVNTPNANMSVRYFRAGVEFFVEFELPRKRDVVDTAELLSVVSKKVLSAAESLAMNERKTSSGFLN